MGNEGCMSRECVVDMRREREVGRSPVCLVFWHKDGWYRSREVVKSCLSNLAFSYHGSHEHRRTHIARPHPMVHRANVHTLPRLL